MMSYIGAFFGSILNACCRITGNFGWGVWIFTFLTRIILLPVSIMVQFNSIKMVKLYPEMNRFKVKYFGDKDMISEAQYELYKREKYHPVLDLIPVVIQLILLMGVVEGIRNLMGEGIDMSYLGLDLSLVPISSKGAVIIIPILAAASALLMCITQNISNVLQSEQNLANKATTLTISVALSLYLGLFVPAGIGLYWIAGNLLSIVQMYALNYFISPKKYVDYEALEASRAELKKLEEENKKQKKSRSKDDIARESADYKRFLKEGRKQIVFYSERNGFYKYYKNIIEFINKKTDIDIHYVTSDPKDEVFDIERDHFHTYYIGDNKFIVLMMKIESDIMVMTTPDLQNFQLKRSYVDRNVEYVFVPHDVNSANLCFRKEALDHFDTIFASGPKYRSEITEREEKFNLKKKNIVDWGSSVIDNMKTAYEEIMKEEESSHAEDCVKKPIVLVAPSWQNDNIMDSCIDEILDNIDTDYFDVIVRPHPQYVRHYESRIDSLAGKYAGKGIVFQKDFSSNKTVYTADMLITDWSSIAYEYSFATLKPVLFINTPMKILNPDYKELTTVPIDIEARDRIGISLELSDIDKVDDSAKRLMSEKRFTKEEMAALRDHYVYNIGRSGEVGGMYLINRVIERSK